MSVRYLIADKTQDVFVDGVYYDLLFAQQISTTQLPLQPYESTALGLVMSADDVKADDVVATATITFDDGTSRGFEIRATEPVSPYFGVRLDWGVHKTPVFVDFAGMHPSTSSGGASLQLRGMTSIDATDKSFLSQPIRGEYDMRLVHSGDVKIYENQRPAPRLEIGSGTTQIVSETPERIQIAINTTKATQLTLRDTCYPGWIARVDGIVVPIACHDILFQHHRSAGKRTRSNAEL